MDSRLEVPLPERVAATLRRLATAFDYTAALIALSDADLPVLREVEKEYMFHPGPVVNLRDRIVEAHLAAVKAKVARTTARVGASDLVAWAQDALTLFFTGVSDPLPDGSQYRVELLIPPEHPGAAATYQVVTLQGQDPRRFLVAVGVKEIVA